VSDPLGYTSTFEYDPVGNLMATLDPLGHRTERTYDAVSRLVTSKDAKGAVTQFAYDGLGRRAQTTINSVVTAFRYDGLDVVKERSGGTDVVYVRTLNIDEGLVRTDPVDTGHYLGDALGSSVALTTPGGTAGTTYTYEPFGRTETAGSPSPNPFRFTGREDDGTGLYYYRARYYDPGRGRFVSQDPIGLAGGGALLPNIPSGARDGRRPSCDDPRSPRLHHNPDLRCRFPPPHPDRSPRPDHAVRV
jgi:RHS repeat-associated protein